MDIFKVNFNLYGSAYLKRKPCLIGTVYNASKRTKSSNAAGQNPNQSIKKNKPSSNIKKQPDDQSDYEPTLDELEQLDHEAQEASKEYTYNGRNVDILGVYLHELGSIPLLERYQEIEYAKKVQACIRSHEELQMLKATFVKSNSQSSLDLAAFQEPANIKQLKEDSQVFLEYRRKLVEANLRLVVSIAKKYQKRGVELIDLLQMGAEGLIRAAEKFDPTKGFRFSTYAYWWIRQAVSRGITQESRTIRLPVHIYTVLAKIRKASRELLQKLGRNPTSAEIAKHTGIDEMLVRKHLTSARIPLSLDQPVSSSKDDSDSLGNFIPSDESKPTDLAEHSQALEALIKVMEGKLTSQEKDVLHMRFGIGCSEMSLAEVGKVLNLSRERVRQIESNALGKLRRNRDVKQLGSAWFK